MSLCTLTVEDNAAETGTKEHEYADVELISYPR